MKDFLHYLAGSLVENSAAVKVEQQGEADNQRLLLSVDKNDLGKIIGKKGRTIKAVRTVLSAIGKQKQLRVSLEITGSPSIVEESSSDA